MKMEILYRMGMSTSMRIPTRMSILIPIVMNMGMKMSTITAMSMNTAMNMRRPDAIRAAAAAAPTAMATVTKHPRAIR